MAVTEGGPVSEERPTPGEPRAPRPEAQTQPPPQPALPSGPEPPSQPVPPAVERTRVSALWTAVAVGVVVLTAILIFVAQNSTDVSVHFLAAEGELPLGVALLFATLLGAILVLAIGTVRILQLRRVARRHHRARP